MVRLLKIAKNRFRKKLGPSFQRIGYSTGVMHLSTRLYGSGGAIIIMYHSVAGHSHARWIDPCNHVPADIFNRHMLFLSRRKKVIPLDELVAILDRGGVPEDGTVVITFDDGYLDNLTVAGPILDRYELPATLFLPTGYIDRGETQWVDQAYSAFKFHTRPELSWGSEPTALFKLDDPVQKRNGYQDVCEELLKAGMERRRELLTELYAQLQPTSRPPRLTMTWDDVRTLLAKHRCFRIGGHTAEHIDLTGVSGEDAKIELTISAQRIKDELGFQPRHFSFCYGRTSKFLQQLVAESGVEAAFGACGNDPVVNHATDRLNMQRVEAPASMDKFFLAISPANRGVWRKLGR